MKKYFSNIPRRKPGIKRDSKNFYIFEAPKYSKRKRRILFSYLRKIRSFTLLFFQPKIFFVSITLIFFVFVLYVSQKLEVKELMITRGSSLIDINQAYQDLNFLRDKSMLQLPKESIESRLQSSQAIISHVDISRNFPSTLNVHIHSHESIFQSNLGLVMSNGTVFTLKNETVSELDFIDIVGYEAKSNFRDAEKLITQDLRKIQVLLQELKKNIVSLQVSGIKYYTKQRELHILDKAGTLYTFDLDHSIDLQVEKMAIFWKERKSNVPENEFLYIDVRIPQKLFLCRRENERNCIQNMQNIYGVNAFIFTQNLGEI